VAAAADGWAGIAVATVFVVNALAHAFGTLVTSSYSPGLVAFLSAR